MARPGTPKEGQALKPNPDLVDVPAAQLAAQAADGNRQAAWSRYIIERFRQAGCLALGCDAKDFYAWFDRWAGR